MAKNALAKKWSLVLGEGNRRYSDAPLDLVPPTPPVIAVSAPGPTQVHVQVTVPSVDARHPVVSYTFEYRTQAEKVASAPWTVRVPVGAVQATTGFDLTNLLSNTTYWFRAKATDGSAAGNTSSYSPEVSLTTQPSAVVDDWWPNWPMMSMSSAQGVVTDNLLDSSQHALIADFDGHMFQSFGVTTTRLTSRVSNINAVHALQAGSVMDTKFLLYTNPNKTTKDQVISGQTALEVNRDFIQSATDGNPNWYLKRIAPNAAQVLEPNFGQSQNRQCNMARGSGLNSHGETYVQTYARKWEELLGTGNPTTDLKAVLAGQFSDNYNARVPNVWINNGASQVLDYDMDADGAADPRTDFSSGPNAGSRKWAEGHLDWKTAFETEFPGQVLMVNSAQYDSDYLDGLGTPPLPIANHPHYKKFELMLAESRHLSVGINKVGTTSYTVTPGSLSRLYRGIEIQKRMLKDDPNSLTGRGAVLMHTNLLDRTYQEADYEYARFFVALALLVERVANSVNAGASRVVPLDERNIYLGNPLTQRSMGTLNESTSTFSLRAPDQTVGVAQFWKAEFEFGLVVIRGDYPVGPYPRVPYPGTDPAVSYTLPSPGAGKVWRMPNAATYVNPVTDRPMRSQNTTLNNGAIVTSLSMRPLTARFVLRV